MAQTQRSRFSCCDGVTRRGFVGAGMLGLGGLTLADLLRLEAQGGTSRQDVGARAVIYLELAGGPTQFETYDPKPAAPAEYRGPLGTVGTRLAGVRFSEMMAHQAGIADRLAVIRSIHHKSSSHQTSAHLVQTGYYLRNRQNKENEMPCAGAVTSRSRGANVEGMPAFVSIPQFMRYGQAAHLGKGFNPLVTGGNPNADNFRVRNLHLHTTLDSGRLDDRRELLAALDEERKVIDTRGVAESVDEFSRKAFELVAGGRAREAFDLSDEADSMRDRYGRTTTGQSLLLARRLVEAGVSFVTVRVGGWDDHRQLVQRMENKAPAFDQGVAALVSDLYERGMDGDVMVVAMGEFGRTPRVNRTAGRDHWGALMSVMVAGGGLRMGQVIGESSPKGETPVDAPYRPEDVLATMYDHLGIDRRQTFLDFSGRPRYVLERGEPIRELTG